MPNKLAPACSCPSRRSSLACNKQLHRCHGLDWRLNLYAIAHVLWKPLFGLGGHPLAGGVVSDFFRPKIQQIVDAASAHDPADRPPIDDLRNALFSLVRGQVAPYCVPQNVGVVSFSAQRDKADKMLHGAPIKDAPRWDAPETIDLPKLTHGEKPITLTNWFFKFQPTPQMPMTVRLLGVYNEQPWGSSPIYVRQNATLLRTRSGKAYMLRGAVNCEGLKTEGFNDEFCHKFHYGFPSRWKETLADAWDKLQNTLRKQFFAKHAPKTPLKYDAAEWIDRSELSMSGGGGGGGAGSASEDFVVALSSEESEGSAFSIRTKAKSGGVAHAVWLSASATETTDGDQVDTADDDTEPSAIIANHDAVSEKPGDAAAVKQLLADERAEKSRLAALASKSPCGAEGIEAEGACCLVTCGACGGARCETHTGGRAGCCPDQIHRSGLLCHDNLPPCILQPIAASKAAALPQRVSAPHDACSWAPSEVAAMPYDIEESHALLASSTIGAKRCTVPHEAVHVGLFPQTTVARAELLPNPGRITVDIAVTVTQAPLELVIGIGNGTSSSFQQQITVLRFNGDTKQVEVAKNPLNAPPNKQLFHDVAEGITFNIRAIINPNDRTLDVSMRDFVTGAPPMHDYAKAVPFVSSVPATPFTPAVAVGGIADADACAHRIGFATLLRRGGAVVCFGTIATTRATTSMAAAAAPTAPVVTTPKVTPKVTPTVTPKAATTASTLAPSMA
jgi:hypothetical protein